MSLKILSTVLVSSVALSGQWLNASEINFSSANSSKVSCSMVLRKMVTLNDLSYAKLTGFFRDQYMEKLGTQSYSLWMVNPKGYQLIRGQFELYLKYRYPQDPKKIKEIKEQVRFPSLIALMDLQEGEKEFIHMMNWAMSLDAP